MNTFTNSTYSNLSERRADYLASLDYPSLDERDELQDIFEWMALLDSSEVQS